VVDKPVKRAKLAHKLWEETEEFTDHSLIKPHQLGYVSQSRIFGGR
jgi:hypothetical protein